MGDWTWSLYSTQAQEALCPRAAKGLPPRRLVPLTLFGDGHRQKPAALAPARPGCSRTSRGGRRRRREAGAGAARAVSARCRTVPEPAAVSYDERTGPAAAGVSLSNADADAVAVPNAPTQPIAFAPASRSGFTHPGASRPPGGGDGDSRDLSLLVD